MGWVKSIIVLLVSLSAIDVTAAAVVFGRYSGVIRHEALKRDQLAKLELIASREEGNILFLKGILTLHFGDYTNKEYVAYHFDDVRFNLLTQTFIFDQPDQPISLVTKQVSGNRIEGVFRSSYSGEAGKVLLSAAAPVKPEYPLVEPVWGEYRGLCESPVTGEKTDTTVQLYTYRSSEVAGQVGNPFRAYKIRGFVGLNTGPECRKGNGEMCVWGNVREGAYNFYKNQLQIFNNYRNLSCVTEPDGIKCNRCDLLKRVSGETKGERVLSPIQSKSLLEAAAAEGGVALSSDAESIQGEYVGYVHHEYLDKYQLGSLNVLTYQAPAEPGATPTLRMSALASLYFGEEPNFEAVSYRFDERAYPNPIAAPQFVFSQPKADVDAILQVTKIGEGVAQGIWFSQAFGRVGSFVFYKAGPKALPAGAVKFEPVSGEFQGTNWDVSLEVSLGVAPPGTENPFTPLTFAGYAINPAITPRKYFTGGSYDFYTGRLAMEIGDETAFVGDRPSGKRLSLRKLYYAVTSPLPEFGLEPYRRMGK